MSLIATVQQDEVVAHFEGSQMVADVWRKKYALQDEEGTVLEKHPMETRQRHADALEAKGFMREALLKGWFTPAGRIQYALGNPYYKATCSNCFVVSIDDDSIEGIFTAARRAARTYSYGGGVGINISPLRPNGARVRNCARKSSGAVSFMDLFSTVTGTMGQHGRRGALMLMLRVDHPDIEEFIYIKSDVKDEWKEHIAAAGRDFSEWVDYRRRVRHANISVMLTDEFLDAVKRDEDFVLRYDVPVTGEQIRRTVRARDLWQKIARQAHSSAEPGIIFWDHIRRESPSDYYPKRYHVVATNPCSEQPLPPDDSCTLGHIPLQLMVLDPFTEDARIGWTRLKHAVRAGVDFLDQIISLETEEGRMPLSEQEQINLDLRRIGLGVMGLGELFVQLGILYGSEESIKLTDKIFAFIRDEAYRRSAERAAEYGPFRVYDFERHKHVPMFKRLPQEIQDLIEENGLRNVALLTIAPTGTTAMLHRTTGGIEPFIYFKSRRRVFNKADAPTVYYNVEPVVRRWAEANGYTVQESEGETDTVVDASGRRVALPDYFVTAEDIDWQKRVELQAAAQAHIDSAISSTVNLPRDATVEDVAMIYLTAWEKGCKGITVYREGSREDLIARATSKNGNGASVAFPITDPPPRLDKCPRFSYVNGQGQRVMVNVGFHPDDATLPIEVEIQEGKAGSSEAALAEALARVISVGLQEGVKPERFVRTLRGIQEGAPVWAKFSRNGGKPIKVTSTPDAVAAILQQCVYEAQNGEEYEEIPGAELCTECSHRALVQESGCEVCRHCGYSRCD